MENITVHIIGCGDAFAAGGRFNTCFYVKAPSLQFLIDCGASSLVALKRNNIDIAEIDMIAITHFHGDHFGGLPFVILDASLSAKRVKPLSIISPPGCRFKVEQAIELFYPGLSADPDQFEIDYIEYQPYQTITMNAISIETFPVNHSASTFPHAFRITIGNKIIGFSGDTEWTDELLKVAEHADLFICECSFFETEMKGHLNYYTLLQKQTEFNYKKILLTHLGNEMLENLANITFECADDGKIIVL